MESLKWSEKYSVGVQEIDIQHRGLLDTINQIIDSIVKGNEWETTSRIVDSLINYAYHHFSTEERLMKQVGYSELDSHIELHLDFIKKISGFAQETAISNSELQREMLKYVTTWYSNHVLGIDRKYIACFSAKGIK